MRNLGLGFVGVASPVMLLACVVGGPIASWIFALAAVLFPIALIGIGASRLSRRAGLWIALAGIGLLTVASTVGLLTVSGRPGATLVLMLCGLGVVPLIVLVVVYAVTFDEASR